MANAYYTLASWTVQEGQEAEFLRVWKEELAPAFLSANATANGTLIQSLDKPRQFYSFGPWQSLEEMQAARDDPGVGEAIRKLVSLCDEAKPGPFRVVMRIPEGD
jgi:heme-degrading monooxygenase HmoA